MRHWTQPTPAGDASLIAAIGRIDDPLEMLECMLDNSDMVGSDPYYRHINDALWAAALRIVTAHEESASR